MTQQRPQLTDVEAIRHRYAMERDKRIREDSNGQYVDIEGGGWRTLWTTLKRNWDFSENPSTKPSMR